MGTYTNFEMELQHISNDELIELFLSGELDKMYENYENQRKDALKFNLSSIGKRCGGRKD